MCLVTNLILFGWKNTWKSFKEKTANRSPSCSVLTDMKRCRTRASTNQQKSTERILHTSSEGPSVCRKENKEPRRLLFSCGFSQTWKHQLGVIWTQLRLISCKFLTCAVSAEHLCRAQRTRSLQPETVTPSNVWNTNKYTNKYWFTSTEFTVWRFMVSRGCSPQNMQTRLCWNAQGWIYVFICVYQSSQSPSEDSETRTDSTVRPGLTGQ